MTNKKKRRAVPPYVFLCYLFVITFVMTGVSFARFGNTKTAADAAKAAKFEISIAEWQADKDIELYIDDDNGTQVMANYVVKVKSISEVPVTYDMLIEAPSGNDTFPFGLQLHLTPIDADASDAQTKIDAAKTGKKTGGTHSHNSQPVDSANPSKSFSFTGCGIAPAGTHTQAYVLNFHFKTADNSYTHGSTDYSRPGMQYNLMKGIKITITAHDGRNQATPNTNLTDTTYGSHYTK